MKEHSSSLQMINISTISNQILIVFNNDINR
jgi:hypothetical protein